MAWGPEWRLSTAMITSNRNINDGGGSGPKGGSMYDMLTLLWVMDWIVML